MVDDDLVTRIDIALAVDVIRNVKKASAVMAQVLCRGLS